MSAFKVGDVVWFERWDIKKGVIIHINNGIYHVRYDHVWGANIARKDLYRTKKELRIAILKREFAQLSKALDRINKKLAKLVEGEKNE